MEGRELTMKKSTPKVLTLLPVFFLIALTSSGCSSSSNGSTVLRVLNAADYIYEADGEIEESEDNPRYYKYLKDEDMLDQFVSYMKEEEGQNITVVYDTFDTNETMYNELMTGKSSYDVIVTSDYMVQKLISNDLIQPLPKSGTKIESIRKNISSYLWDIFKDIHPKNKTTNEVMMDKNIYDYSVPYMWGTVGIMYNPAHYSSLTLDEVNDLFSSWESLYSLTTKNSFSIKDSVRDTYAVSVVHAFYESEIKPLEEKLLNGEISEEAFNDQLSSIFNRCDDNTLKVIKEDMLKLKENSFGFEVDSGKTDMVEGKIGANVAWSGDATWAILEAEESYDKELYFSIPKEGSNIWFDAFCIPSVSTKKDLATSFIEFMSRPENAIQNMDYVGYTSATASIEVLDYIYENYDVRGKIDGESDDEYQEYDISYFFKDNIGEYDSSICILHADESTLGRTLTAQYPNQELLPHLCVMDDFGTQNEAVLDMWETVRSNSLPIWAIIILVIELIIALGGILYIILSKSYKKKMIKERRNRRVENA